MWSVLFTVVHWGFHRIECSLHNHREITRLDWLRLAIVLLQMCIGAMPSATGLKTVRLSGSGRRSGWKIPAHVQEVYVRHSD